MADFYAVNQTKANDPTGANQIDPGQRGGRLRVQVDSIESATGHKNKEIQFGEIPAGSTFIGLIVNCESGWGGGVEGTFYLGGESEGTAITSGLDLNTGIAGITAGLIGAEVLEKVTEDTVITMKVNDETVTADKYIQVAILYSTD
jgi:hypothetical protein